MEAITKLEVEITQLRNALQKQNLEETDSGELMNKNKDDQSRKDVQISHSQLDTSLKALSDQQEKLDKQMQSGFDKVKEALS